MIMRYNIIINTLVVILNAGNVPRFGVNLLGRCVLDMIVEHSGLASAEEASGCRVPANHFKAATGASTLFYQRTIISQCSIILILPSFCSCYETTSVDHNCGHEAYLVETIRRIMDGPRRVISARILAVRNSMKAVKKRMLQRHSDIAWATRFERSSGLCTSVSLYETSGLESELEMIRDLVFL